LSTTRLGHAGGVGQRGGLAGTHQRQVDARPVHGLDVLDDDLAAVPRQRAARRPGRGDEAQVADREGALGQQSAHDPSDLTGCSDDGDVHAAKVTDGRSGRPHAFPVSGHPTTG
jgi:hypothetical protein